MTGLLPHNHGVLQVEHCVDDDQSVLRTQHPHWAQRLSDAGYKTGYFGKWHVERTNRVEDFGWQVNGTDTGSAYRGLGQGPAKGSNQLLQDGCLVRYETEPEGYRPVMHYGVTDVPVADRPHGQITKAAGQFLLDARQSNSPWACCISYSEPNTPLIAGRKAFEQYDTNKITLPANRHDDLSDRPGLYQRQQKVHENTTDKQWRQARAVYYALISELDGLFGQLMDQLENSGQLENTYVIITSDHGRYLGAHGFDAHNFGPFEEAYNIPLIIAGPQTPANNVCKSLVGLHDLGPTLLDLAGAEPLGAPDSHSFAPLLANPADSEHQFNQGYAEYHGVRFTLQQRILWQGPWKFVFNGFDFDELYNLENDPHEMNNLARMPEHQDRLKQMMTDVWRIIQNTNDRALWETHYSPMRMAVVGPLATQTPKDSQP